MQTMPWFFCLLTALWFGILARTSGRNPIAWLLGGGLFGLVASTFIVGVSHAVYIPDSERDYLMFRVKAFLLTAAILGILGWFLTGALRRFRGGLWRRLRKPESKG